MPAFSQVTAILDGAVQDFNKENPDKAVQLGDFVSKVNAISGAKSADKMMKELGKAEKVEIGLIRKAA
eukprot:g5333.t1